MLKYCGNKDGHGWALPNVPARDLSDAEVAELGGEEKLIATGVYEAEASTGETPAASKPTVIISSTGG